MSRPIHVAYVTAGTVGVGDLMHGLALRQAVQRQGLAMRVTLVAPPLPFPALQRLDDLVTVPIDARTLLDAAMAPTTPLAEALRQLRPDVIVVGHFWAPLRHVVPSLVAGVSPRCWLLLRKAPRHWLQGPRSAPFLASQFDRIFEMEPVGFDVPRLEPWPPLVVANREELLDRPSARTALGLPNDGRQVTLVFQAGNPGELGTLAEGVKSVAGSGLVHRVDLRDADAPMPMAPYLAAADVVVTGAGYNAFWEARWLGTMARTRFVPFARRIDDQAWRLARCAEVPMTDNGADLLAQALGRG